MPDREAAFTQIQRIAASLGLSDKVSERAADLVSSYLRYEPRDAPKESVMAAAAFYMSCIMWEKPVSQKTFSHAIGVNRGTINRGYRRMAKILFPNIGECCNRAGAKGQWMPELPSG